MSTTLGDTPVAAYLPADIAQAIDVRAAAAGLSRSAWIRMQLVGMLRDNAPKDAA